MSSSDTTIVGKKCGTITIDVFKTDNDLTLFYVQSNNKNVLNILDIIEDTLKLY